MFLVIQTPEQKTKTMKRPKRQMMRGGQKEKGLSEKNYFFPITDGGRRILEGANVSFCDLRIDGIVGVVVDQDNITRALEIMGSDLGEERETSFDGIVFLTLKMRREAVRVEATAQPVRRPEVKVGEWFSGQGYNPDPFKKIVEEILLPVLKCDIYISNGGSNSNNVISRPSISISTGYSLFSGYGRKIASVSEVFGDMGANYSLMQTEGNLGIILSPDGVPMVEYGENFAFLLPNIAYNGGREKEYAAYRRLCEELAIELSFSPEEKAERVRKIAEAKREKSREAYVKECSKRFEKTVAGTRQKIESGHKEIARLQQELIKKIREVHGAERKMEQLETTRVGQEESYGREFDLLLQVPGVEDVQTADGVIKIFTEHIFIEIGEGAYMGEVYDIGKFRMEIYTSGSNGGIRFLNLTRRGKGGGTGSYNIHHPHVNSGGEPCLGNIKEMIPNLLGEYEYSAIAQIGLQFLKSVNPNDSAGRGIFDAWPLVGGKKSE
jgi:hypothetical protein